MTLKRRSVQLGILPGGELGMVWQDGQPIPPETPMPGMTAGKLAELIVGWMTNAAVIGHAAGVRAAAGPQYAAGVKAGAEAVTEPAIRAGVEAGAKAGVQAGIGYAYANSVVARHVVRDEKGQITGTVEQRMPVAPSKAAV